MAGKHEGVVAGKTGLDSQPFYPGNKLDRSYSEGRQTGIQGGLVGDNPHVIGTPESNVWIDGFTLSGTIDEQIQTCWVA